MCSVANQLNALAEIRAEGLHGAAGGGGGGGGVASGGGGVSVANQSGLAGSCGPLGFCLDAPVQEGGGGISAQDSLSSPPLSASPVLTAVSVVSKAVLMASLATLVGPALSVYVIVRSHWKFLERLEMVRHSLKHKNISNKTNNTQRSYSYIQTHTLQQEILKAKLPHKQNIIKKHKPHKETTLL